MSCQSSFSRSLKSAGSLACSCSKLASLCTGVLERLRNSSPMAIASAVQVQTCICVLVYWCTGVLVHWCTDVQSPRNCVSASHNFWDAPCFTSLSAPSLYTAALCAFRASSACPVSLVCHCCLWCSAAVATCVALAGLGSPRSVPGRRAF
jgi:hypothetical protein